MQELTSSSGANPGGTEIRDLWNSLRRQRWTILWSTVAILALAGLFLFLVTPVYESDSTLQIIAKEPPNPLLAELPEVAELDLPGMPGNEIETEMGILRSRRIAEEVLNTVGLQVRVKSPRDIRRDELLEVFSTPDDLDEEEKFLLIRQEDGQYRVRGGGETVTPGSRFTIAGAELALPLTLRNEGPERIAIEILPFHEALEDLQETLEVDQQEGQSELIVISYRSTDPYLATAVIETAVSAFVEYKEVTGQADLAKRIELLKGQVERYREDLRSAEVELRDYREANQIVEPEEQAIEQVKMVATLRTDLETAIIEREALVQTLENMRRDGPPGDLARQLSAFPSFFVNPSVQSILGALGAAEERRSEFLVLRTPENQDVQRLDQRIEQLESQVYQLAVSYLASLDNKIAAGQASMSRFGAEAEAIPQMELEFVRLQREQELLNEIYLRMQAQLQDATIQFATAPEEVRIVDLPLKPREPIWPKPLVILGLSGVLGLMVGTMISVGREAVDASVRNQWEAEALTGIPVVGLIPRYGSRKLLPKGRFFPLRFLRPSAGRDSVGDQRLIGTGRKGAAEAFRAMRPRLGVSADPRSGPQLLLLTSPVPDNGTSTSSISLALVLAQQGFRTLLIDGDLRHGRLHDELGAGASPGLSDLLVGSASLEQALQELAPADASTPHFVPAGSRTIEAYHLIGSERMLELLEELKGRFDRIVIDAPPVLRDADTVVTSTMVDAVFLVVRSGSTQREALKQAVVRLDRSNVAIAGLLLDDVETDFDSVWEGASDGGSSVEIQ